MRLYLAFILVAVLTVSASVSAESNWTYGLVGQAGNFSINDPDGDTEEVFSASPRIFLGYQFSRSWSVNGVYDFINISMDAESQTIGQDGKGSALGLEGVYHYPLFDNTEILFRAGLKSLNIDFSNRLKLDSDGFIEEQFADRSISETTFMLNGDIVKTFNNRMQLGIGLFIDYSNTTSFYGLRVLVSR